MMSLPKIKHLPLYSETLEKTVQIVTLAESGAIRFSTSDVYSDMNQEQTLNDYKIALWALPRSKIFEISPVLGKMLVNTDNAIYPTRLPFSPMFIEFQLEYDMAWLPNDSYISHQTYLGFMLMEGNPITSGLGQLSHLVMEGKELVERAYPNIYIYAVTKDESGTGHIRISLYKEYSDTGLAMSPNWVDERNYIRKFIMNFLDFLNDPEVEIVKVLRSDRSIRKAVKHGKKPIVKESNVIRINGKLKHYVDELQAHVEAHRHYTHRFWVRGHWRHLTAKCYKAMRGKKVWIPPYIKGEGILRLGKRYYAHQPLPKREAGTQMFKKEGELKE